MLYHTYYQLSHYKKGDISVLAAISDSLINAAQLAPLTAKEELWKIQLYMIESMDGTEIQSLDRQFFQKKIDRLAELVGTETTILKSQSKSDLEEGYELKS